MFVLKSASEIFTELSESLNPKILSLDSIYGIVMLLLFILGVVFCCRSIKYLFVLVGTFVFLQLGHVIACSTQIGMDLPFLQVLFKYDVFTALAQLCVGTPLGDGLLWLQAYLNSIVGSAIGLIYDWVRIVIRMCERVYDGIRQI